MRGLNSVVFSWHVVCLLQIYEKIRVITKKKEKFLSCLHLDSESFVQSFIYNLCDRPVQICRCNAYLFLFCFRFVSFIYQILNALFSVIVRHSVILLFLSGLFLFLLFVLFTVHLLFPLLFSLFYRVFLALSSWLGNKKRVHQN